ncbi:MAG: magnesium chelatase subunit D [Pseudomonadota bacterium]
MSDPTARTAAQWAVRAVSVFNICGAAIGGIVLRGAPGPLRERCLKACRSAVESRPWVRVPINVDQDRLLGGLDLTATLAANRPVIARGLLASAHGGVAVLAMAERQSGFVAASICDVLDKGYLRLERDGVTAVEPAQCAVVAMDESRDDDAPLYAGLRERLALTIETDALPQDLDIASVASAAHADRWREVTLPADAIKTLVQISDQLGIASPRPAIAAANVARALAVLDGANAATSTHVAEAAVLTLLMRMPGGLSALEAPPPADEETPAPEPEQAPPEPAGDDADRAEAVEDSAGVEQLDEAAAAMLPLQLLTQLAADAQRQSKTSNAGHSGAQVQGNTRGRPLASRRGIPSGGSRLDLLATLKAAAPWQRLRVNRSGARVAVARDDLRVRRFKAQTHTTTIFVVDASGSAAVQRLAETKGAIELLLAECYVRRDQVALVAFRDRDAEILLPATRSLVRAKRALAALPGGGGTPLAHGLRVGLDVADAAAKRGDTPLVVLLTDARANIALDGTADPALADAHAIAVARDYAARGYQSLVIDSGRRPGKRCRTIADALNARYLPLPFADAGSMSQAVQSMAA